MQITEIIWTNKRIEHIARHKVSVEEVEEVLFYSPFVLRTRQKKYIVLGQALSGRYLFVVIAKISKGKVEVITARDMEVKERKLFRKVKGG